MQQFEIMFFRISPNILITFASKYKYNFYEYDKQHERGKISSERKENRKLFARTFHSSNWYCDYAIYQQLADGKNRKKDMALYLKA
jgi:hypothetical protein